MIRHIVMFKLKEFQTPAEKQAKMQEKIEQLETEIRELHKKDVDSLNGDKHNSLNNK